MSNIRSFVLGSHGHDHIDKRVNLLGMFANFKVNLNLLFVYIAKKNAGKFMFEVILINPAELCVILTFFVFLLDCHRLLLA